MFAATDLALSGHTHTSHHSGLLESIERGFGWGLGRDAEHLVFGLLPPWAVFVVVVIGLGILLWRWRVRGR